MKPSDNHIKPVDWHQPCVAGLSPHILETPECRNRQASTDRTLFLKAGSLPACSSRLTWSRDFPASFANRVTGRFSETIFIAHPAQGTVQRILFCNCFTFCGGIIQSPGSRSNCSGVAERNSPVRTPVSSSNLIPSWVCGLRHR